MRWWQKRRSANASWCRCLVYSCLSRVARQRAASLVRRNKLGCSFRWCTQHPPLFLPCTSACVRTRAQAFQHQAQSRLEATGAFRADAKKSGLSRSERFPFLAHLNRVVPRRFDFDSDSSRTLSCLLCLATESLVRTSSSKRGGPGVFRNHPLGAFFPQRRSSGKGSESALGSSTLQAESFVVRSRQGTIVWDHACTGTIRTNHGRLLCMETPGQIFLASTGSSYICGALRM